MAHKMLGTKKIRKTKGKYLNKIKKIKKKIPLTGKFDF